MRHKETGPQGSRGRFVVVFRTGASSFAGPVERPAAARTAAAVGPAPAAGAPALAADIGAALGRPLAPEHPAVERTRPVGLPPAFDSCDRKPRPRWLLPRYRRRTPARAWSRSIPVLLPLIPPRCFSVAPDAVAPPRTGHSLSGNLRQRESPRAYLR